VTEVGACDSTSSAELSAPMASDAARRFTVSSTDQSTQGMKASAQSSPNASRVEKSIIR
jgi:hypothetical protein